MERDTRRAPRGQVLNERFYADSSALVKLVREEPETSALRSILRGSELSTSIVGVVELLLTARKARSAEGVSLAEELLPSLTVISLHLAVARTASLLTNLRSLDAIHLATALSVREGVAAIITYDERLAGEARRHGLAVLAPR